MASQNLNVGTSANSNDGDTLRAAFINLKKMFAEVYGQTYSEQGDLSGTDFKIRANQLQMTANPVAGDDGKVLTYDHLSGSFTWEDAFTGTIGDITGIVAGEGLTGSSLDENEATLNVGAGTGITVANDSVSLAASVQSEISANTAKDAFPGFGTTAGTSLEGDTSLLQVGTLATDALAGNTTTITTAQAGEITDNTAKVTNATHTGDVTDASGVLTIADNVVNATKLDVAGDGAAGQLLQSDGDGSMTWVTGVTGDVTGVTAGDGLDGGGTSGDLTISLDTGVAGDGLTLTSGVLDVSVATSQIADDAVTSPKLAEFDDTFTAGTSGDIIVSNGTDFIHATMSGDATIVAGGAITIADDAVTTDKILDDAVTADKLADSINTDIATGVAKVSFPGFGTSNSTALVGDTRVITSQEITNISNNTTKTSLEDGSVDYDKLADEFTLSVPISSLDVDFSSASVFTKALSGTTTLTFSNVETGMVKTLVISGNQSLALPSGVTYLNGTYSGTATKNIIQIVSTNGSTEMFATVSNV